MKESEIRKPDYSYDVNALLAFFEEARIQTSKTLDSLQNEKKFTRARLLAYEKQIDAIIAQLNADGLAWAESAMDKAATEGAIDAIMALDLAPTRSAAASLVAMSTAHEALLFTVIADTHDDLLGVTQNMSKHAKRLIRGVYANELRAQRAKGNNSYDELKKLLNSSLQRQNEQGVDLTIIDGARRKWKQRDYVDMLVQTKMMHAHKEATINRALEEGTQYGKITRHGAKDACSRWEGKIVKLDPDAPGDYPYYGDLPNREIFHPRCRHRVLPIHNLTED